jgi:hypothetical protein
MLAAMKPLDRRTVILARVVAIVADALQWGHRVRRSPISVIDGVR